jgi:hypothetical protein
MALVDGNGHGDGRAAAAVLSSQSPTPIALLRPDLPDQDSRVVRGEVTITWPYNSVTKTLAFLLAEPDVRLRRAKGQIRIVLQGPSATAAAESGLGAGDELLLGLPGAHFSKDVSPGRIPGARVDWQLQFDQKLVLQVCTQHRTAFVLCFCALSNKSSGQIRRVGRNETDTRRPPRTRTSRRPRG